MINDDLNPPYAGLNADPVLYGVAAGLAKLFPPDATHVRAPVERDSADDEDRTGHDAE